MGLNSPEDPSTQIESRNLTQKEERYLQRQVYYFFPFLRVAYEFLKREKISDQSLVVQSINNLKDLCHYYAGAFVFGEFDLKREQQIIDELFVQMGDAKTELKRKLSELQGNRFNTSDGDPKEYFFGDRSCTDVFNLSEKEFDMGVGGGLISLKGAERRELLFGLAEYIKKGKKPDEQLAVWGNVARGAIDGAAIDLVLKRMGIPSEFYLYRMSTQAYKDKAAFSLGEQIQITSDKTWSIGVDSMSSGGKSVPESVNYLRALGYPRVSFFLTWSGYTQKKRYPVGYQWDTSPDNEIGTLLECSNKK